MRLKLVDFLRGNILQSELSLPNAADSISSSTSHFIQAKLIRQQKGLPDI